MEDACDRSVVGVLAVAVAASCSARAARRLPRSRQRFKVAIFTDIGGLNDKGFNHLAYLGLQRAKKELQGHRQGLHHQLGQRSQAESAAAAQAGYGTIFAVGVLYQFGPIDDVVPAFPKSKFVGSTWCQRAAQVQVPEHRAVSSSASRRPATSPAMPRASRSSVRRPARTDQRRRRQQGSGDHPLPRRLQGRRQEGELEGHGPDRLRERPDLQRPGEVQVRHAESGQKGSRVDFMAAGGCGLGGLKVAKQTGHLGHRRGRRPAYLGKFMLTSAVKHVERRPSRRSRPT